MLYKTNENKLYQIRKITVIGAIINIILSVSKILVGYLSFSQALIADGIHSLSDLISDGAVLIGSKYWGDEPDKKHPYGHGRIETLVTLGIGIALAVVAIGMIRESLLAINEVRANTPGVLALVVALVSVLSKEIIYRWTIKVGKKVNSRALIANAWHHRTDAFSSIPVAVAVIGIWIFPQLTYLDNIAAILVSLMLIKAAWDIASPCISEIMEEHDYNEIDNKVVQITESMPNIYDAHNIKTRRVGMLIFVEMHILVDGNMTVSSSHQLADKIEEELKKMNNQIYEVTIHIEPKDEEQNNSTGS